MVMGAAMMLETKKERKKGGRRVSEMFFYRQAKFEYADQLSGADLEGLSRGIVHCAPLREKQLSKGNTQPGDRRGRVGQGARANNGLHLLVLGLRPSSHRRVPARLRSVRDKWGGGGDGGAKKADEVPPPSFAWRSGPPLARRMMPGPMPAKNNGFDFTLIPILPPPGATPPWRRNKEAQFEVPSCAGCPCRETTKLRTFKQEVGMRTYG